MKLSYHAQIILAVVTILLANILSTIFKHWIYRSAGFVICGLLWIVHPVLPQGAQMPKHLLLWTRVAGFILILMGVFTRSYIY